MHVASSYGRVGAIWIITWIAVGIPVRAQTGVVAVGATVTAGWVVQQAVAHSAAIRIAESEIDAAAARHGQALAAGLPAVEARAQATRYFGLTDVSIGALTIDSVENRYGGSLGLVQPVYTGGRVTSQQAAAVSQEEAARLRRQGTEFDVILQALAVYWGWSKVHAAAQALRTAVVRMEAHAADMRHQHEAGLATENDLLATDVRLDSIRLRLQEAERAVELSRARMQFMTGQAFGTDAVPEPAVVPDDDNDARLDQLTREAARNRVEPAAQRADVAAAAAQLDASRGELRPQVTLAARYEAAQPNPLFFPPSDEVQDDAFAGIVVTWSVLDWGLGRNKIREAGARYAQAEQRQVQVMEQVELDVKEAFIGLHNARERVVVARRVEQSAARNLEVSESLWKNGLVRHSDVLDAEVGLTDAEYERIAAESDVALAGAVLRRAVGRPFDMKEN